MEDDKTGESDFSPGQAKGTTSLLPLPGTGDHNKSRKKKHRSFTALFTSSSSRYKTSSASTTSTSAGDMSTTTSPLVPTATPSPVIIIPQTLLPPPRSTATSSSTATTPPLAVEESTSEDEDPGGGDVQRTDGKQQGFRLRRKISVNSNKNRTPTSLKEGYLMKQTSSFQRWHKRYFKIVGKKLLYGKDEKSQIFEEVDLSEVTIAESSSKSCKSSFQVITPHRTLHLGTEKRSDMIDWANNIRAASDLALNQIDLENLYMLYGSHNWIVVSNSLPTYCNVCRDSLCVTSTSLSCEICRLKSHKRCALLATPECKWTNLSTMEKVAFTNQDGELEMPHQWIEGNLPMSSKCRVCSKGCGSVLRLQDWYCLWCEHTVHNSCKSRLPRSCRPRLLSTVPPWALRHVDGTEASWEAPPPLRGCSPLLVFVNSKSGNNQGLTLLNRFKVLLNPAQVFDLITDGPTLGLTLFKHFKPFRILVCGGDGSVGWVLAEMDRLNLQKQCQIGVLPLGTGNDLARVLGWGASFADDAHLYNVLLRYERATSKMLDRWSVKTYERSSSSRLSLLKEMEPLDPEDDFRRPSPETQRRLKQEDISECEQSVVNQLKAVVELSKPSHNHEDALKSGKELCEAVKKLIASMNMGSSYVSPEVEANCGIMTDKLNLLLQTLQEFENETAASNRNGVEIDETTAENDATQDSNLKKRNILLQRANSLETFLTHMMENGDNRQSTSTGVVHPFKVKHSLGDCSSSSAAHRNNGWFPQDTNGSTVESDHVRAKRTFSYKHAITQSSSREEDDDEDDDDVSEELRALPHLHLNKHPTIEIESPSTSSSPLKTQNDYDLSETDLDVDISLGMEQGGSNMTLDESPSPEVGDGTRAPCTSMSGLAVPPQSLMPLTCGVSPRASRRVSTGSLLKPLDSGDCSPTGTSSSSAASAPPSPHKKGRVRKAAVALLGRKKKLPIINPLLLEPAWCDGSSGGAGLGSGGFISRALIQNVDTICAVASPLMDMEEELGSGFKEHCVMNNYFGIGIDAKITLAFHLKREQHPELCGSRIRNFVWYGILGGREYLLRSCRNLERRVILECDGHRIFLPSLQGIVILNIQSFMGGTNFWGGVEADDSFLAPSFDDRILEVVAVYDVVQMAASRMVQIQHHRIAQCESIKITILGDDPLPVQVDGEAWLQAPGAIKIGYKNRAQMLCRSRELEFSLKAWDKLCEQQANGNGREKNKAKGQNNRYNNRRFIYGRKPMIESGDTDPSSPSSPHSSGGDPPSSEHVVVPEEGNTTSSDRTGQNVA